MAAVTVTRPKWRARWAPRRLERGAGRRGVLTPDQFRDHGCLGDPEMRPQRCHDADTSPRIRRSRGMCDKRCPDKVKAASPLTYISPATRHHDPPRQLRPLVPTTRASSCTWAQQGVQGRHFHQPAEGAARELGTAFSPTTALREAATMRSHDRRGLRGRQSGAVHTDVEERDRFLDKYMK